MGKLGVMNSNNNRLLVTGLCVALFALTISAYWSVWENDFVNYDDPDYVLLNDQVKQGLTWNSIKWAYTAGHASNWHPLTWISHMADVSLFGLNPAGHHVINLLFHCANTILLFALIHQITKTLWRSLLVAGLFALHPIHVESVAWIAERKDVLSAFFGILTLIAYAHYAVKSKAQISKTKAWYVAALVFFALGLLSKPMLVTWPCVMLLLDFWPLQRFDLTPKNTALARVTANHRILLEKIPFLVLATISCLITLQVQQNAMSNVSSLPLTDRFGNALLAYQGYLAQTFWPTKFAIFYPHVAPPPQGQVMLALAILMVITVIIIIFAQRFPVGFTGWFWYLGTLVPVIGIVQVGGQAKADRYTYLPLIGIFILFAWIANLIVTKFPKSKIALPLLMTVILVACAFKTNAQLRHWKNSETLFTQAIKVTNGNYIARAGLGIIEFRRENYVLAIQHLTQALEMVPPGMIANQIRYYIGATLQKQGKGLAALPYFEQSPEVGILQAEREYRLALSLIEAGRLDEAEHALNLACAAKPDNADFLMGNAALLHRRGKSAEAERVIQSILTKQPDNGLAYSLYAHLLLQANRLTEAETQYDKAVKLLPDDLQLRQGRALNLARLGKYPEAFREFEVCLTRQSRNPEFRANYAAVLIEAGELKRGIEQYEQALKIDPNQLSALNNLSWLLATNPDAQLRNGNRAVELGEQACKLTDWKVPVLMGTLAAAYAEAGRFDDAVATATKARDRALEQNQADVAKHNGELLKKYQSGQPIRD